MIRIGVNNSLLLIGKVNFQALESVLGLALRSAGTFGGFSHFAPNRTHLRTTGCHSGYFVFYQSRTI
jgi:hypothetical protein